MLTIGKSGKTHLVFGLITIIISISMVFFIFYNLETLSDKCKSPNAPAQCKELSSFTIPMMIILLIIGGFFLTICTTVYVLISAKSS